MVSFTQYTLLYGRQQWRKCSNYSTLCLLHTSLLSLGLSYWRSLGWSTSASHRLHHSIGTLFGSRHGFPRPPMPHSTHLATIGTMGTTRLCQYPSGGPLDQLWAALLARVLQSRRPRRTTLGDLGLCRIGAHCSTACLAIRDDYATICLPGQCVSTLARGTARMDSAESTSPSESGGGRRCRVGPRVSSERMFGGVSHDDLFQRLGHDTLPCFDQIDGSTSLVRLVQNGCHGRHCGVPSHVLCATFTATARGGKHGACTLVE